MNTENVSIYATNKVQIIQMDIFAIVSQDGLVCIVKFLFKNQKQNQNSINAQGMMKLKSHKMLSVIISWIVQMVKTKMESWLNALLKRLEITSLISLSGRKIIAAQLSWYKVANASLSKQLVLITFTHVEIQNILSFGFNEVEQHGFFIHQDRKKFFISIGPRMVSNPEVHFEDAFRESQIEI